MATIAKLRGRSDFFSWTAFLGAFRRRPPEEASQVLHLTEAQPTFKGEHLLRKLDTTLPRLGRLFSGDDCGPQVEETTFRIAVTDHASHVPIPASRFPRDGEGSLLRIATDCIPFNRQRPKPFTEPGYFGGGVTFGPLCSNYSLGVSRAGISGKAFNGWSQAYRGVPSTHG